MAEEKQQKLINAQFRKDMQEEKKRIKEQEREEGEVGQNELVLLAKITPSQSLRPTYNT